MIDSALDWLVVAMLLIPMAILLGIMVRRWVQSAVGGSLGQSVHKDEREAEITAVGFEPDGDHHRLRLRNAGDAPARDVRVYVNNEPITAHRRGPPVEDYPIQLLRSGSTISFRYAAERGGVIVRTEWDDRSGGGTWEAAMTVS